MNTRLDHSPIRYPDVIAAPERIPAPAPSMALLYAAQDEMADYSQTMPRHIRPTDYDELTTRAEKQEQAVRRVVSDKHYGAAACELFEAMEKKRGSWAPMLSELAVIDFMEQVDARAMKLAEAEIMAKGSA